MSAINHKPISKASSLLLMALAIGFSLSNGIGPRAHANGSASLSSTEDDDVAADDLVETSSAGRKSLQSCISSGLNSSNTVDCSYSDGTKVRVSLSQRTRQVKKRVEGSIDQFETNDESEVAVDVTAAQFCESCNKEIEEKTTIALPISVMQDLGELNEKILETLDQQKNHLARRKSSAAALREKMDNCEIDHNRKKIASETAKYQCFIDHLSAWNNDEEKGASYFNEHLRDHLKELIGSTDKSQVALGSDMVNAIANSTNVSNPYIKKSVQEMAKFVDYRQKNEQTLANIKQQRDQMASRLQQLQTQMNGYCQITNTKDPRYNAARQQCASLKQIYQNQADQDNQALTAMNQQYSQYKNSIDTYFRNEGLQVQNMNFAAPFENQALTADVNDFIAQLDQQYTQIVNQHAADVSAVNMTSSDVNPRFGRGQPGVTPNMNMVQTPALSNFNAGNPNLAPSMNMNVTAPGVRTTTTPGAMQGMPQFGSRVR